MPKDNTERRRKFVQVLGQTGSRKIAEKVTARQFRVTIKAVQTDWRRRSSWPPEIFAQINNPVFTHLFTLEIRESLNQIEKMIRNTENSNCKLGAIRTKVDTLFKLVNLQRAVSLEKILERMEKLESRLDILTKGPKPNQKKGQG